MLHLTGLQKDILRYFYTLDKEDNVNQYCRRTGKDRKDVWLAVDALVKEGLIHARKEGPGLPRWLQLTQKGAAYAECYCGFLRLEESMLVDEDDNDTTKKLIPDVKTRTAYIQARNEFSIGNNLFDSSGTLRIQDPYAVGLLCIFMIRKLLSLEGKIPDKALLKELIEGYDKELVDSVAAIRRGISTIVPKTIRGFDRAIKEPATG